jgi:hypothetical protein
VRRNASIMLGVAGQTLAARVTRGQATSATFAVFRQYGLDESTPEFSGAATVSTVNTTSTAAAGASQTDPQAVTLTSVAGIAVGSLYLLTAPSGVKEWVTVIQVVGLVVRVRFRLANDYAIGATFQGCTLTAAVDNTWVASLRFLSDLADTAPDYRVKWTIVIGGATYFLYTFFDLVRSDGVHHVEMSDVNERVFGLLDSIPIEYQAEQGRPIIDGAWRAVRADLIAHGIHPDSWRDDEALDELVLLRTIRNLAESGLRPPSVDARLYLETASGNYDRYLEMHVMQLKHRTSIEQEALTNPYAHVPNRAIWSK